jgi:hypothetical protein
MRKKRKEEERRACLPLNDGALCLPEPFDRVAPSGVRHKGGMLVDRNSNVISQRDVIDLQPKNTATEFPLKKIQSSENLDSKKQKNKTKQKEEQRHLAMRENPGERKEMEIRTSMSSKDQRPNSFTSG